MGAIQFITQTILKSSVKRHSSTLARNDALEGKPAFLNGPSRLPLETGLEHEVLRERLGGTLPTPSVACLSRPHIQFVSAQPVLLHFVSKVVGFPTEQRAKILFLKSEVLDLEKPL